MTQHMIQAGWAPTVIVRASGTVQVAGREIDRVVANSEGRWGLKVKRRGDTIEVALAKSLIG